MEMACCSENSSKSTNKFAREERESGAVERGPSLALVVGAVAVLAVVGAGAGAGAGATAAAAAVVAEAE